MAQVEILHFGKRRIGKSLLPQDQIAKRNEFDDAARMLACLVRRARVGRLFIEPQQNVYLCFGKAEEASEFLRLMAKVQRRRKAKVKK